MEEILAKIEEAVRALVLPEHAEKVDAIVVGGQRLLYDEQSHGDIMDDMSNMDTKVDTQKVALGVAGLVTLMKNDQQGGSFPDVVLVPVTSLLMVDLIRFMSEAGMLKPNIEFIGNAFEELYSINLQKMGIGPEDLASLKGEEDMIQPTKPTGGGVIEGAMQ